MLNSTVPTWANGTTLACSRAAEAFALISNTSSSGNVNGMNALQSRPSSSRHCPDASSKRTICEGGGAGALSTLVFGCSVTPAPVTTLAGIVVVRFPEWKMAA